MKIFGWERNDKVFNESTTVERHLRYAANGCYAVEICNWSNTQYTIWFNDKFFPKLVCKIYNGRTFEHINDAKAVADKTIRDQDWQELSSHLRALR